MMIKNISFKSSCLLLSLLGIVGCTSAPVIHPPVIEEKNVTHTTEKKACQCVESKSDAVKNSPPKPADEIKMTEPAKPPEPKIAEYGLLKASSWEEIEGFSAENISLAWPAWRQSCSTLRNKPAWKNVCESSDIINTQSNGKPSDALVIEYFKNNFSVYQSTQLDGTNSGLITGYYEPVIKGSRIPTQDYPHPLYATPSDLITVALDDLYPDLKFKRVRGRLVGNKLVPYFNRAEIEAEVSPIARHALVYIQDKIDGFFLQIQGSGLVTFENGEEMHIGYADQNGHAYQSIGKLLIANGELTASEASMQGIKDWALKNPSKLQALLNQNPSYVFFRELPAGLPGPLGALGVPLLATQAIAVDPKFTPLGAPVFLVTTYPNSTQPLKKLMMAQDTGGAIKGGVRADFYWGSGALAGEKAGAMKQIGQMWVLLPIDFKLPSTAN